MRHQHLLGVNLLHRLGHIKTYGQVGDKDINLARWIKLLIVVRIAREEHHIRLALLCIAINLVGVYKVGQRLVVVNGCDLNADVANRKFVARGNLMTIIQEI